MTLHKWVNSVIVGKDLVVYAQMKLGSVQNYQDQRTYSFCRAWGIKA